MNRSLIRVTTKLRTRPTQFQFISRRKSEESWKISSAEGKE